MYIDVSKCNDYDGTRAGPSHKRTTNSKACISMPLEKLGRSDLSLVDRYLYIQHFFQTQPRLLWESGETSCALTCASLDYAIG